MSDYIIKRLREAIAWLRAQQHIFDSHPKTATDKTPGSIADNIAALLDRLDKAEAECERLPGELKTANTQAEHFEREWYLRGDEIERLYAAQPSDRREG